MFTRNASAVLKIVAFASRFIGKASSADGKSSAADIEIHDDLFDSGFIHKEQTIASTGTIPTPSPGLISSPKKHRFREENDELFGASFPEGVDELYFQVVGVIKDVERLKLLYELFAETLEHLCRMGAAYKQDPGVKV